jgi:hypothetical protein
MSYTREKLKDNMGYVMDDDVDDLIQEFGEDFKVVIKFYCRDRVMVTLKELKEIPIRCPHLDVDIREVFVPSEKYRELFG